MDYNNRFNVTTEPDGLFCRPRLMKCFPHASVMKYYPIYPKCNRLTCPEFIQLIIEMRKDSTKKQTLQDLSIFYASEKDKDLYEMEVSDEIN